MSDRAIQAQMLTDGDRVVIYDAARLPPPVAAWFDPTHWPQRRVLDRGRGATYAIDAPFGAAVLRRYRRGGAVARVLKDSYVWTGADHARPLREFRLLAAAVAALALVWLGHANRGADDWEQVPAEVQTTLWPVARPVAEFTLTDQDGRPFAADHLHGHWSLLYFGYLQCPDVCPTTLQSLRGLQRLQATEAEARKTRHVFVSVDPVRPSLPAALVAHGASRRIGGRPAAAVLAHSAIVAQFVAGAV